MNENDHVYCTNCFNFRLCDEEKPYCMYENKCNINNCEDSREFKDRPFYEEKTINEMLDSNLEDK